MFRVPLYLLLLVAALAGEQTAAEVPNHPNILFLFTDDQRADTVAALGNPRIRTPSLDSLVNSGFTFTNAYCMGSTSPAVCLPSRTMLLSGRSLFHIKGLGPDSPNMAKSLRAAGYECYHHGKRANTPHELKKDFHHSQFLDDDRDRTEGFPGRAIADGAVGFLKQRDKSRPFFMYLAFANPHDERVVNAEYRATYSDAKMQLPKNFLPFHPFDNGDLKIRDEKLAPWPRSEPDTRRQIADYYAVISYLDSQIGRVLAALRETGQYENTVIVFSSDHGLALGGHGLMGKQSLYEHSMKAPLIVAGPGIHPGKSQAFVYLFDLFPTFCELAGTNIPGKVEGKSLLPVIRGEKPSLRDAMFTAYRDCQRAVRIGDWKLIRYPQVNVTQLFNLKEDPDEVRNLADLPTHAGRVAELTARLRSLQKQFDDPLPLTSESPKPAAVDLEYFTSK